MLGRGQQKTSITLMVRKVPVHVHRAIKIEAARRGVTINAYILDLLRREAEKVKD